jgi:Family of unknown function (DUF6308)
MSSERQELDVANLVRVLQDDQAPRHLQLYYGVGLTRGQLPPFTGGRFELLGGGGDRAAVCNCFTAEDVLAVELLSVQLPPHVALDLLEGGLAEEATALLEQIPAAVQLWDEDAEKLIRDGGPADRLWHLLQDQEGVGWVTAGKLLARKRPALIPVYDDVVRCAFGRPGDVWAELHMALRQNRGGIKTTLEDLAKKAGIPAQITLLRTLDVAIWMSHRTHHSGRRCVGLT